MAQHEIVQALAVAALASAWFALAGSTIELVAARAVAGFGIGAFQPAARAVVAAAKYHPLGSRGVCRFVRAADYGIRERGEHIADANRALVVLQVEGLEGISNLDTILDVEGFDVLFVGPYDLSQSVGRPGLVDHSEVLELISTIAEKSRRKGVALGSFADTPEALRRQAAMGFTYLSYGVDQNLFLQACSEIPSLDH